MANGTNRAFLREFIRNPHGIGAVAPSSQALAEMMVEGLPLKTARVVVEYGPGTGPFTGEILRRIGSETHYIAIERSGEMVRRLRERFPKVDLCEDSVVNVAQILAARNLEKVDCIISGLPWAAFDAGLQDAGLRATRDVLRAGGDFVTFAYLQGLLLPAGMRFAKRLRESFSTVKKSPVVWGNLPPALVYRCKV